MILYDEAIIAMLADGLSTKEIAKKFNCSDEKTEMYRSKMFRRYGVKNAAHMVSYAYKNGILKTN